LLDEALQAVAEQRKDEQIEVQRGYQKDLPSIPLDENLCEQAFVNLIQNAYDAMSSTGGILRAEVHEAQSNSRRGIQVRLQDTGPGIPIDMREQVFNPFVTTKKTGVGLGLSIVSKIVDEHHGTIRLDNSQEQGACFEIFFPAEEESQLSGAARI